jgi:hypothetical protein
LFPPKQSGAPERPGRTKSFFFLIKAPRVLMPFRDYENPSFFRRGRPAYGTDLSAGLRLLREASFFS